MSKAPELLFSPSISKFLSKQNFIVLHSNSALKQMIRKALAGASVTPKQVDVCVRYDEALTKLAQNKNTFVFCASQFESKSFNQLLDEHLQMYPNRLDASFIVIESDNSPSAMVKNMAFDIDGVVTEPLTLLGFVESISKILKDKIEPDQNTKTLEVGKIFLRQGKFSEALAHFEKTKATDPARSNYYLASIKMKEGIADKKELITLLKASLAANPIDYKSLELISKLYIDEKNYEEAYDTYSDMLKNFPINPEFIPNIIRVSIYKRKYEEILAVANFFSTLEKPPSEITRSMAAGLAISAKYFFENANPTKGIELYRKSAQLSNGSANILRNISSNLIKFGKVSEAEEILNSIKGCGIAEEEFEAILLEVFLYIYPADKNLVYANNLIAKNCHHAYIYEAAYMCAIKINKTSVAEDIYTKGAKLFPELKAKFKQIKAG